MEMSKLVWTEGLFLRPQHMQHQDAYHENALAAAVARSHAYPWGLQRLTIANNERELDRIEVVAIDAVMPDGLALRAPVVDESPAALSIALSEDRDTLIVGLSLPAWRHEGANCPGNDRKEARYTPRARDVPDLHTDEPPASVQFARLQPRLVFLSPGHVDSAILPIAQLRRGAGGRFRVNTDYIAPVLAVKDSPALLNRLTQFIDVLHGKIAMLTAEQTETVRDSVAYRAGDQASFWLLHTLGAGAAALAHLRDLPVCTPERLFQELLRLAGGLLAFRSSQEERQLPTYQHWSADTSFATLFATVRKLVDTVIPTRFVAIVLSKDSARPSYFTGTFDSEALGGKPLLYLAVASGSPDHELVATLPRRLKIGSSVDVEKAVASALPCVPLKHLTQLPSSLPAKANHLYFALDNKTAAFMRMLDGNAVTAFIPSGFDDIEIELIATLTDTANA